MIRKGKPDRPAESTLAVSGVAEVVARSPPNPAPSHSDEMFLLSSVSVFPFAPQFIPSLCTLSSSSRCVCFFSWPNRPLSLWIHSLRCLSSLTFIRLISNKDLAQAVPSLSHQPHLQPHCLVSRFPQHFHPRYQKSLVFFFNKGHFLVTSVLLLLWLLHQDSVQPCCPSPAVLHSAEVASASRVSSSSSPVFPTVIIYLLLQLCIHIVSPVPLLIPPSSHLLIA